MQVEVRPPATAGGRHPFNPPYLIPLVEVVGGEKTAAEVVAWTADFFRHAGKSVITMDREVPGFIANRLQEALWREALHMVADGEATVEQIDPSITDGPGLRWAFQGPMLTFHLAGGPGRHGAHARPLRTLAALAVDAAGRARAHPRTARRRGRRAATREADGRSIDDLVRERDRGVIAILRALGKAPRCLSRGLVGGRSGRSGSTTTATCPSPTTCWSSGTPPTR